MERPSRENLKFSCFVIGTTLTHRAENMLATLKSIDLNNFPFKIFAVKLACTDKQ